MDIDKSLNWLKLSPKQALIALIISSILLFANEEVILKLGLLKFRELAKTWIGVVWLVSLGLLSADSLSITYKYFRKKVQDNKEYKDLVNRLNDLSDDEKKFLSYYVKNNTKTQSAELADGTANGLEHFRIIYRASTISQGYTTFPWNIQDWAWKYLKNNPSCLE